MLEQAARDWLTDFLMKESLNPFLEELIADSRLNKKRFLLGVVDVDHLKRFNDKFGHVCGDQLLKYTANTIYMTFCKHRCYFFRYGGDEFVLVFPDERMSEVVGLFRECNQSFFRHPFYFKNRMFRITVSSGLSVFPDDGETGEELIKKADEAMYLSKRYGRNNIIAAGRIKYLKILRFFIVGLCAVIIAGSAYILYHMVFKEVVKPAVSQFTNIKIVTQPTATVVTVSGPVQVADLDEIIFKSGKTVNGKVLGESGGKIIVRVYIENGEASMAIDKKDILTIKYGKK